MIYLSGCSLLFTHSLRTYTFHLCPARLLLRLVCGALGGLLALAEPVHHVVTTVTATDGWCLCVFFVALVGRSVGWGFCVFFCAAGMAPTGGDYRHCERWLSSWWFLLFCSLPLAFAVFLPFWSLVLFWGGLGFFFCCPEWPARCPLPIFARVVFTRLCLYRSGRIFAHASSIMMFSTFFSF